MLKQEEADPEKTKKKEAKFPANVYNFLADITNVSVEQNFLVRSVVNGVHSPFLFRSLSFPFPSSTMY